MTHVLDELKLTELVTSIPGLSTVGAATILAETGDPNRFATARALVKHAGLAPREKLSGTFTGRTKLTGQGRPRRVAVLGRGLAHSLGSPTRQPRLRSPLPAPDHPRAQQAQANPGPDRDRRRDPAPPACRRHHRPCLGPPHRHPRHPTQGHYRARRLTSRRGGSKLTAGRALRGIEDNRYLDAHHGHPRPSSHQPDYTLLGPSPLRLCRDRRRTRHRPEALTQNDLR